WLNIQQARAHWESLRNIEAPEYKEELSNQDDWRKIIWWIEWAIGQLFVMRVNAYKEELSNQDDWRKIIWWIEWAVGQFLNAFESERNPLMQQICHESALALDGRFRVAWRSYSQSSLQRRNSYESILEKKANRCGGPHKIDLTKLPLMI
ncbi:4904_t:CDS:2, partial [Gigaspora margarita]